MSQIHEKENDGLKENLSKTFNQDNLPLFEKVRDPNTSPQLQIMDLATLFYLQSEGGKARKIIIHEIFPDFKEINWEEIEKFIPDKGWFTDPKHVESIHGQMHLARVVINAMILSQVENLTQEKRLALLIAGGMHDIARVDDRVDPGHGQRAAEWLRDHKEIFDKRGLTITEAQLKEAMILCQYHEVPIEKVPQEIVKEYGQSLRILKHADLLERYRLPNLKWWPKIEFMSNEEDANTRRMLDFSKYLCQKSEMDYLTTDQNGIECIKKTAGEIGVIKK